MSAALNETDRAQEQGICGAIDHSSRYEWVCIRAADPPHQSHRYVNRYPDRSPGGTA
jgi:hypothetical protein